MSLAIIQITQEELSARAINTNSEELIFENQVFAKGPSFSLQCKEPALKYCQHMATKNLKSLLIEVQYGFTIWTQSHKTANKERNFKVSSLTKAKQESVSSSKMLRKYRGQVHEVNQKDNQDAPKKQRNFLRSILRQKYRGHYLD